MCLCRNLRGEGCAAQQDRRACEAPEEINSAQSDELAPKGNAAAGADKPWKGGEANKIECLRENIMVEQLTLNQLVRCSSHR